MAIKKKTAAIIASVAALAVVGGGITAFALNTGGDADAAGSDDADTAAGGATSFNLTADQDRVHLDAIPEAVARQASARSKSASRSSKVLTVGLA